MPLHVYIGWDPREADAWNVASWSLRRHASIPVVVHKLDQQELRDAGLFSRTYHVGATGQRVDDFDGKPFSTDFTHTRFLVPYVHRLKNLGPKALFIDCDWLFRGDVADLLHGCALGYSVYVVKHNYLPLSSKKMMGVAQQSYKRKLWSAMMLFDVNSPACLSLTPNAVNCSDSSYLHQLGWCREDEIGELDEAFHWIPGSSPTIDKTSSPTIKGVHFTEGLPGQQFRSPTPFDEEWYKELQLWKWQDAQV